MSQGMQPGALPSVAGACVIDEGAAEASRLPERHTLSRICRKQSSYLLLSSLPVTRATFLDRPSRQSARNGSMLSWIGEGHGGRWQSGRLLDRTTQPLLDGACAFCHWPSDIMQLRDAWRR